MRVREAKFKDFKYISQLQKRHKLKSIIKYKKKFLTNYNYFSKKNPIGWVLEDKGKIRGFIGNFIKKYYYNNKSYYSSAANSLVLDEDYRANTFLLLRKYFKQKKISFFFNSSPNYSSFKIWKKLGAYEIPQSTINRKLFYFLKIDNSINSYFSKKKIKIPFFFISIISFLLAVIFIKKRKPEVNDESKLVQIKKFDQRIKTFFKKNFKKNKLNLSRDRLWFDMYYNKQNSNKSFIYAVIKKSKIIGLIGFVEDNDTSINLKRLKLSDIEVLKDDKRIYDTIFRKISSNTNIKKYDLIETQGFSPGKFNIIKKLFHLDLKTKSYPFLFKSDKKNINLMLNKKNIWDFSLIDGDNLF